MSTLGTGGFSYWSFSFLSIEFQETGYLVYRFYKTGFGDSTSPYVAVPVPVVALQKLV